MPLALSRKHAIMEKKTRQHRANVFAAFDGSFAELRGAGMESENMKMLTNYHTHTVRCGHAAQMPDEDFVRAALESGFSVLGFSDHTPWPYKSGFENRGIRMTIEQLPEYLASIRALREKYEGQIEIRIGLECEYFPEYLDWLRETRREVDYLILGNHYALTDETKTTYFGASTRPEQLEEYARCTILGMQTGLFSCLAHPELVLMNYPVFDEAAHACAVRLCGEAKRLELPLEYNLLGAYRRERDDFRGLGYPCDAFWRIAAQIGCSAVIGFDAHWPQRLRELERYHRARDFLESLGVKIVERLEFR